MQSPESGALEPTRAELNGVSRGKRILRLLPVYGPVRGPAAAEGKMIVVLAADLKNGGILGATYGVEEAAEKIGWEVRVLDGAGSIQGRTAAIGQALVLKPDGTVINGFDPDTPDREAYAEIWGR